MMIAFRRVFDLVERVRKKGGYLISGPDVRPSAAWHRYNILLHTADHAYYYKLLLSIVLRRVRVQEAPSILRDFFANGTLA